MSKRRPAIDPRQIGFTFELPSPARTPAALAGLSRVMSATAALALKDDPRSRHEIAGAMTDLLAEPVSKMMLDAYASEARDDHGIPAHRLWALLSVTDRLDLLDALVRRIGAALLVGEEIITAEIGQIDRQMAALKARRRAIEGRAPIIRGGKRS